MITYPFSQQTAGQILEDKAETCGQRVFLEFEDGKTATYKECNEKANRIANGFLKLGVNKGESVATFIPNSPDSIYLWFGTSKAGIVEVPINLANKGNYLSHIINNSHCKAIVIDRELIDRLKFIENDVPTLEKVVVWSKVPVKEPLPKLKFEVMDYSVLEENFSDPPGIAVQASDPMMIIYTSGTTGAAKGVLMAHALVHVGGSEYIRATRVGQEDVFFTCLPLFHGNARLLCVAPALLLGAKAVIYERFSASRFWDWTRKHGATVFNTLGAIGTFLYNQPRRPGDGDNPVRVCAAFPMPAAIYSDFEKRFNLKIVEGYGLTETGIITWNPYEAPKIGSCGKETELYEVKIVDENHFPVPAGTVGEVVARGRIPWALCLGYVNMPEKTVELMQNHFVHTGDAGYIDRDGYLFFKDRIKDYIRRRGENISSAEIESVVNSYPKVAVSAAIGVKSELSEDEVKIVVVLKDKETLAPEELIAYCVERMPYFAVPRYVEFVQDLPRTPNEKIQKAQLREMGVTSTTWDREEAGVKVTR